MEHIPYGANYRPHVHWIPGRENYAPIAPATPLHPDTLMPVDKNKQDKRINDDPDAWQLGLVLGSMGIVQKVADATPAQKAKMIFESQV